MEKYVTLEEYKEMFKIMMQLKSMQHTGSSPPRSVVGGVSLPPGTDKVVRDLETWEVREDDIWLVTYPKAGTTWTQEIVACLMHNGDLDEVNKTHTSFQVLYMELNLPEPIRRTKNLPLVHKIAEEMPSPRVFKSHLPGHLLPPQLVTKKPKTIYVFRNPKDLVVSFFYFSKMIEPNQHTLDKSFGQFFDEMLAGTVLYGPWWEHYLYFWKRRHEPNLLVLHFEDLKKDLRGNVEKIGQFVGKDLSAEKLDAITDHCTFANMKKNPMSDPGYFFHASGGPSFMRKGTVGDWRSHFTVAQNETMDAHIQEKLEGTGLKFNYD